MLWSNSPFALEWNLATLVICRPKILHQLKSIYNSKKERFPIKLTEETNLYVRIVVKVYSAWWREQMTLKIAKEIALRPIILIESNNKKRLYTWCMLKKKIPEFLYDLFTMNFLTCWWCQGFWWSRRIWSKRNSLISHTPWSFVEYPE